MQERLQKILAHAGIASRRHAEEIIQSGRVTVNGAVVRELGVRADAACDVIAVDGARLPPAAPRRTIVVHKPRGIVSTLDDPEGRPTVRTLLGGIKSRLYPVGRLDVNTTGLLLLTNDGGLAAALLHPRRGVPRVYHAKVRGAPGEQALTRVRRGVHLEDGKTLPAEVRVFEQRPTKTWLEITVREGRSRLVRRLCEAVGHPVEKLARVRFGPLTLGKLSPGSWRDLTPGECGTLQRAAGLSAGAAAAAARPRRAPGTSRSPTWDATPSPRATGTRGSGGRARRGACCGGRRAGRSPR